MKYGLCGILIVCFLIGSAEARAAEKAYDRIVASGTLKCGYVSWPPYFDKDVATGKLTGYSKDLTDAVAKLLDLKVEYVEVVLGSQVDDLRSGRIDAVCGDGPYITASAKYLNYTSGFLQFPLFIYGRADDRRFKNLSDLNKKEVAFVGIDGDFSTSMAQMRFPNATLKTLPGISDPSLMMLEVSDGKADIAIVDPLTVKKFNATNPKKILPVFGREVFASGRQGFSVLKGEYGLKNMLDEGIEAAGRLGLLTLITDDFDKDRSLILRPASPYQPYGK